MKSSQIEVSKELEIGPSLSLSNCQSLKSYLAIQNWFLTHGTGPRDV